MAVHFKWKFYSVTDDFSQ